MYVASGCFQVAAGELSTCRTVAGPLKLCVLLGLMKVLHAILESGDGREVKKRFACFKFFFKYMPEK